MYIFKKLLKLSLIAIIIMSIVYLYLMSDYNSMFKNERFVEIQKSILESKSKNYSDLMLLFNKIEDIEKNKYEGLNRKKRDCPCLKVVKNLGYPNLYPERSSQISNKIVLNIYAKKIEESFTQNDCLKFLLASYEFHDKAKGIEEASFFFFGKQIKELSQDESISLILLLENSSLYNPLRNKIGLQIRINEYQLILKKPQ